MEQEFEFMPRYRIGNEAMQYKLNSKLFPRLEEAVHQLRAVGNYDPSSVAQSGIAKIVMEETGICIQMRVEKASYINAGVYIPELDRNNPILTNYMRGWRSNSDLHKVINFNNGTFNGLLDKKNGKVAGDFSKMIVPVFVTSAMMLDAERYTDSDVAAAIGHEVGHLWSYFERLIDLLSMNYAASYVAERVLKTATDVDRISLITEYEKAMDIELADKETIARSESGGVIYTHLVLETIKNRRNAEGNEVYSYRGFEFSSDQFVTRHGGGLAVATVVAKINQDYGHTSTMSWTAHILLNVAGAIVFLAALGILALAGMWFTAIVTGLLIVGCNPHASVYDNPEERLQRIRNEMVGSLKEATSPEQRASVSHDIALLDGIMKDFEDKPSWHELIWNHLLPNGRKTKANMSLQQDLEKLMNNDLFVAAARLEQVPV